jgi:hypothetical protein
MIEDLTKWVASLAPFMAPYPGWVKIAFSIFVLSGATWLIGLIVAAPSPQKVAEKTQHLPEPTPQQVSEPTAWLTIKGVTGFGTQEGAYIRVTATVNGVEYTYPSLSNIQWLEIGPEMAPETFQIPVRDIYRVRFSAKLRRSLLDSMVNELASVEEQRVVGKTNGISVYTLRSVHWREFRGAAPVAEVHYTISRDSP